MKKRQGTPVLKGPLADPLRAWSMQELVDGIMKNLVLERDYRRRAGVLPANLHALSEAIEEMHELQRRLLGDEPEYVTEFDGPMPVIRKPVVR